MIVAENTLRPGRWLALLAAAGLGAAVASGGGGWLVVASGTLLVALVFAASTGSHPGAWFAVLVVLLAAGLSMGLRVPITPWLTVSGAATVALCAIGALCLAAARPPAGAWRLVGPLLGLLVLGVFLSAVYGPSVQGIQNMAALLLMCLSILLTAWAASTRPAGTFAAINMALLVGGVGVGVLAVVGSLGSREGVAALVGPRTAAAFLLLPLAWAAGRWWTGRSEYGALAVAFGFAVVATMSRTASFVAILILTAVVMARARVASDRLRRRFRQLLLMGGAVVVAGACLMAVAAVWPAFEERFAMGDVVSVTGSFRLNVMGRAAIWPVVWRSAGSRPVFGWGPGSSQLLPEAVALGLDHPHNDYLRVFHDYGAVGLALLLAFGASALTLVRHRVPRINEVGRAGGAAAGGALAAAGLLMLTDNVLVYPFFVGPLGVILGYAAGVCSGAAADVARPSVRRGESR